jgi:hypothetical protein
MVFERTRFASFVRPAATDNVTALSRTFLCFWNGTAFMNDEENWPGLRLRPHPSLRAGGCDVRYLILHRQTHMPNADTHGQIRGEKFSQPDWQHFTEDYQRSFGEPG